MKLNRRMLDKAQKTETTAIFDEKSIVKFFYTCPLFRAKERPVYEEENWHDICYNSR